MTDIFNAIVADEIDGILKGRLVKLSISDLPDEKILVDVDYSTVNFKDGLAASEHSPMRIAQKLPMVCGIDLAGTVAESSDPDWKKGDRILVNGYGLSEKYWGGYSQKARLKPEWLIRTPDALSSEEAMAIGTAGYTAMLCVLAIEDHGVKPTDGPILVTGASGGVGSIAVSLLSTLGYEVVASTGRMSENGGFLKELGASRLIGRAELSRPSEAMEAETWAAVVDCVGGQTLATALAQTCYNGVIAMTGLTGGTEINTTVLPFILRNISLHGIDSVQAPHDKRQRAWDRLADVMDLTKLKDIYVKEPLARVPELTDRILGGKIKGRIVIDVNA